MLQQIDGFEPSAWAIVAQRHDAITEFWRLHGPTQPGWHSGLLDPSQHLSLLPFVQVLTQSITQLEHGLDVTVHSALLQLASTLTLYSIAEERIWARCHASGLFDRPRYRPARVDIHEPDATKPIRPTMRQVGRRVRALMASAEKPSDFTGSLVSEQLCRNLGNAQTVTALLQRSKAKDKDHIITKCIRLGLFDRLPERQPAKSANTQSPPSPRPARGEALRPRRADILQRLRTLQSENPEVLQDPAALLREQVCHDPNSAEKVASAHNRLNYDSLVNRMAIDLVLRVMSAYAKQGRVGLLDSSGYGSARALIELEWRMNRQAASRDNVVDKAQLRRDMTAIYNAFSAVCPEAWNENLLRAPIASEPRHVHRERISPEIERRLVDFLVQNYTYDQTESAGVVSVFLSAGQEGLIDFRGGTNAEEAGIMSQRDGLWQLVDSLFEALSEERRRHIMQHLEWLQKSLSDCKITASLPRIVAEQPSSPFRRRLKRRLPMSFGVVQYFRKKRKRAQARIVGEMLVETWNEQLDQRDSPLDDAERLVKAYAARANLDEQDAASRLYDVWTYCPVGFIPRDEWLSLVDARLLALLKLYKFGRIEGRLILGHALSVVNSYAQRLGHPAISLHLARTLLALLTKPGRWNSGEGEKVAAVRKRAGVVLPGTPWLHRVWRVLVLQLPLRIAQSYYSPPGDCWLIVIIDLGSQLPVGCWVSAHRPKSNDVKLALFQSIWHPGALDWPLRGIPEIIQIPTSVVGVDAEDMRATASWLLASVQIVADTSQRLLLTKMSETTTLLRDLVLVGLDKLRRSGYQREFTVKEVQHWVLKWLRESEKCFGTVRPALPDTARIYGFAAPAFDTPAAGLLLPVVGTAITTRDAVFIGDRQYADAAFRCEPGQSVRYRQFPYLYRGPAEDEYMRDTIFVDGVNGVLHYLTRQ